MLSLVNYFLFHSCFSHFLSLTFLTLSLSGGGWHGSSSMRWRRPPAPPAPSAKWHNARHHHRSGGGERCGERRSQMRLCRRRGSASSGWCWERTRVEWWRGGGHWHRRDAAWLRPPLGKRGGRVRLGFTQRARCDGPWKRDLCWHDPTDRGEQQFQWGRWWWWQRRCWFSPLIRFHFSNFCSPIMCILVLVCVIVWLGFK